MEQQQQQQQHRIVCLLPAATDICIALGLQDSIVGITHECHIPILLCHNRNKTVDENHHDEQQPQQQQVLHVPVILTSDGVNAAQSTQNEIHCAIQEYSNSHVNSTNMVCPTKQQTPTTATTNEPIKPSSLPPTATETTAIGVVDTIPSLYPIDRELLLACQPTIIFTQDLCSVCGPSSESVYSILSYNNTSTTTRTTSDSTNRNSEADEEKTNKHEILIVSLTPHNLIEVSDTFVQVANACGIKEKGIQLKNNFLQQFHEIRTVILQTLDTTNHQETTITTTISTTTMKKKPRMLLLEWLDPPFDAGHWIPDLMYYANVEPLRVVPDTTKSIEVTWERVQQSCYPIDILLVACCAFQLERNVQDTILYKETIQTYCQPAYDMNQVYALNADRYIVNPNPYLVGGAIMMALIAYHDHPPVVEAIMKLPFIPPNIEQQWKQVSFVSNHVNEKNKDESSNNNNNNNNNNIVTSKSPTPINAMNCDGVATTPTISIEQFGLAPTDDIEDLLNDRMENHKMDFDELHEEACLANKNTYLDPDSGYTVFTEVAHKKRGYCCGSGCRHCPFNHMNITNTTNKIKKIQQPAFLYREENHNCEEKEDLKTTGSSSNLFAIQEGKPVKVLFFSGGKDSFLTIRALVRLQQQQNQTNKFGLVLVTTFDATSRLVAHQNVHIEDVVRQAEHLKISLVGVPLHRGNKKEGYLNRIQRGLKLIESVLPTNSRIDSLVFGDLHLEHIYLWRNDQLSSFGYELMFPLYKVHYQTLEDDLIASCVPCEITSVTVVNEDPNEGTDDGKHSFIVIGKLYDTAFRQTLKEQFPHIDLFGEKGEFHTLAKVWEVSRSQALGLK